MAGLPVLGPLRVLFVSHMFPSSERPGYGRFIYEHVAALQMLGVEARVLQPVPWAPAMLGFNRRWRSYRRVAREQSGGSLNVVRVPHFTPPGRSLQPIGSAALVFPLLFAMRRAQRDFAFEIVHAHSVTPDGFAAVIAGSYLRKSVVVSGRGSDVNEYPRRNRFSRASARLAIGRCDRFVGVSRALVAEAASLGDCRAKAAVIYNGVDFTRFSPPIDRSAVRRALGLPDETPLLVFVGALEKDKGVHELGQAFERMTGSLPRLTLVAVGDGPLRYHLECLGARLQGGGRVLLPGTVPAEMVADFMRAADVLVHPSHAEGLPNVVLEAMACGLPVVATSVGGIPEVVEHERTGLLVPPRDARALEAALMRVIAHPEWARELGRAGRALVLDRHSWERNAREHIAVYSEVLSRAGQKPQGMTRS